MTVIGLGPMGQALAGAFLKGGHRVTVWNRSAGRADALVAQGAVLAGSAAEAVQASPIIIICVLDYNAVHAILEPAVAALKGRTLVNLTADTPMRSRQTAAWAAECGIDYLDGAIMTPTPTIGTPKAVVLYSGPEPVYRAAEPALASLGGTASYLGEDPGRVAAHDVALLDLFWTTMSGYVHALALAQAENIAPKAFAAYAQGISAILPGIMADLANRVDEGRHPGDSSSLLSAATGMEHILQAAEHHGMDVSVISAAKAAAQRAIDAGYGADGFSRLAELLRKP
ncbi:NAD(P)-binding domain-containing protein [Paenibacillus sp. P26]|nr:NAD(P)-binding domain-containing protein [Paenibacillus sp. P26]